MTLPPTERVPLLECLGRVLAEDIPADRDYPPFNRSMRDGFAVRAADLPGSLKIIGEVRAGNLFDGDVNRGEAVEIMTGAPVPRGADAVVMVEQCVRNSDGSVSINQRRTRRARTFLRPDVKLRSGDIPLKKGQRLDYLATFVARNQRPRDGRGLSEASHCDSGHRRWKSWRLKTSPPCIKSRNSNAFSLAVQVKRAGGDPVILPIAPDELAATRHLIEQGLQADLLLLSGGVSAGKYDVVEPAFAQLGAEFFFDRVLIQPGAPVVFGKAREKFFDCLAIRYQLSSRFEVFARAALDLLSGAREAPLPMALARLTRPLRHKGKLTRFLPAVVSCTEVTPVGFARFWRRSIAVPC